MIKLIEFAVRKTRTSPPTIVTWDVLDIASVENHKNFCKIIKKDGTGYFVKGGYRNIMNRWIYVLEAKHTLHDRIARPSIDLYHDLTKFEPDMIHLDEHQLIDICKAIAPDKLELIKENWARDLLNEDDDE
jgi:hypothetical protein